MSTPFPISDGFTCHKFKRCAKSSIRSDNKDSAHPWNVSSWTICGRWLDVNVADNGTPQYPVHGAFAHVVTILPHFSNTTVQSLEN